MDDFTREVSKLFQELKELAFPAVDSKNEFLEDVFFDLLQYDSYVAGTIDLLVKRKKKVKLIALNKELEEKIKKTITSSNSNEDKKVLKEMLLYVQKLNALVNSVNDL